jgi:prophage regulatory protein
MSNETQPRSLLRLTQVLERIPVSRSTWLAGVKTGRFPKPHRIGNRCTMWLSTDIERLIDSVAGSANVCDGHGEGP